MTSQRVKRCRHSVRLHGYDYAQPGAYYITICTHGRQCLMGDIEDGQVRLNDYGRIVHTEWTRCAEMRCNVELDEFVVMPNHFHSILVIADDPQGRGTVHRAPTLEQFGRPVSGSLPTVVRYFKGSTTRRINALRGTPGAPVWQRSYYEHVIRDEQDLREIREYIAHNPAKWDLDSENPSNL